MFKRFIVVAGLALWSFMFNSQAFAAAPDFAAGIQFTDHGCVGGIGQYSLSAFANKITGAWITPWASDSNYYDPDCGRVMIQTNSDLLNKDVRICIQIADKMAPNHFGVITWVDQIGVNRCTPWASEGGGWSGWAYDTSGDDPDGGRVTLETRALPAQTQINDLRLGIQTSDHKCDRRISNTTFTPWASEGGGWSGWATGGADPNCYQVDLQVKSSKTGSSCSVPVSPADQPTINLSDIQYVTTVRSGATVCPAGRVFVGVDQQDHAGVLRMKCAASTNVLGSGATTDVPLTIPVSKGNFAISNNCPADSIINGLIQNANGRETAVRCQPVKTGSINFNQAITGVGTHGRSGDRYEVNFNENKTGEWVAFGAVYNVTKGSEGISGYQLKPRTDLPPTPNACEVTPAPSPIPNPLPTTPTTPGSNTTTPAPTCSLTATPSVIALNVGSSKLEWNCSGSGTVTISATNNPAFASVLNQPAQGSLTVSPNQTTTFRVTSASASANVTVIVGGTILDETGGL